MTIQEWDESNLLDWSRRRDKIKPLFYTLAGSRLSNYVNLTPAHKLIGAKYFFVGYDLRVLNGTVTPDQDKINSDILAYETRQSRIACSEAMRVFLCDNTFKGLITLNNTQRFLRDVLLIRNLFIDSNDPWFKQWITSERGSDYEFKGFKYTSYYSQFIEDGLMNIYNGDY